MPVAFKPRHAIPRNELIKESRNWLDLYLGPINWTQQTDFLGNRKLARNRLLRNYSGQVGECLRTPSVHVAV